MALSFSKDDLRKEINGERMKLVRTNEFFSKIFVISRELFDVHGRQINFLILKILAILATADLEKTSSKVVRSQLEEKLKVDLTSRKKELDKLIMECVNSMQDSDEESSESEPEPVKPKKRKADSSDESDYKPAKSTGKKRKGSSSDSDEDWSKKKKTVVKKGYTGFTRPYKLSPELASLMGAKELPRHEVVKKVWVRL